MLVNHLAKLNFPSDTVSEFLFLDFVCCDISEH